MEPVDKPTYWDHDALSVEDRRSRAKRNREESQCVDESDLIENEKEDDEGEDDVPIFQTLAKRTTYGEQEAAKLGDQAVGAKVSRKFGKLGLFTGEVVGFDKDNSLYSVEYVDGDREDFDEAEYLFAFDLYQSNERSAHYNDSASDDDGFTLDESDCEDSPKPKRVTKKRTKPLGNLTDVKRECVAGKELSTMTDVAGKELSTMTDCEDSPKPKRVTKKRTKLLGNLTDVKREYVAGKEQSKAILAK